MKPQGRHVAIIQKRSTSERIRKRRRARTWLNDSGRFGLMNRYHRIDPPRFKGDLVGLDAAAAPARPVAGGEHGRQVRDPERPRLSSPPIGGGPPVSGEHPDRPLAGGSGLPGQLRAEARRGDRHRGARRGASGVVQLGEVGGQGHIVERPAAEPGVRRRAPAYARRVFGLTEASTRRRAVCVGRPIAASSGSILAGESFMLRAIISNNSIAFLSLDSGPAGGAASR